MSFHQDYRTVKMISAAKELGISIQVLFDHCIQLNLPLYIQLQSNESAYSVGIKSQTPSAIEVYPKIDRGDLNKYFGTYLRPLGKFEIDLLKLAFDVPNDILLFQIDQNDYFVMQAHESVHTYALFESALKYDIGTFQVTNVFPNKPEALNLKNLNGRSLLPATESTKTALLPAYKVSEDTDPIIEGLEQQRQEEYKQWQSAYAPDRLYKSRCFAIYADGFKAQPSKVELEVGRILLLRGALARIREVILVQSTSLVETVFEPKMNSHITLSKVTTDKNDKDSVDALYQYKPRALKVRYQSKQLQAMIECVDYYKGKLKNFDDLNTVAILLQLNKIIQKLPQYTSADDFSPHTDGHVAAQIMKSTLNGDFTKGEVKGITELKALIEVSNAVYGACVDYCDNFPLVKNQTIYVNNKIVIALLEGDRYKFPTNKARYAASIIRCKLENISKTRPKKDRIDLKTVSDALLKRQ